MNSLHKRLIYLIFIVAPLTWFGFTMSSSVITWYHGYAEYFIGFLIVYILIFIPIIFSRPKYYYLFNSLLLVQCLVFNIYSIALLFFPQWNGWGSWNKEGHWNVLYFLVPPDFSYWTLGFFFLLLAVFGGKKFFELDFDAIKKDVYKENKEIRRDHTYIIEKSNTFSLYFKPKYLVKTEHYVHGIGFFLLCIIVLPMQHLGSSMTRFGNDLFTASFFFISAYFFSCLCLYFLIGYYARHIVFQQIEKELGVKLQPIVRIKLKR